jgi:hypothetical protein
MKVAIGFIAGMIICAFMLMGIMSVLPISADTAQADGNDETNSLIGLVPDVEKIYRESLIKPLISAESQIYDEDIRQFYRGLLESTGLTEDALITEEQ